MQSLAQSILVHLRDLYLANRFFVILGGVSVAAAVGFWYPGPFWLASVGLGALSVALVVDIFRLYHIARGVSAERQPPHLLSVGDELTVSVVVRNDSSSDLSVILTDELPTQLQIRDQRIEFVVQARGVRTVTYSVRPTERGAYHFGDLNIFLRTAWSLAERRLRVPQAQTVPAYPSILQMKKFALRVGSNVLDSGRQRQRRLTKSYEFDQIKEYVAGDDYRSINWRATGRRAELMVNKYEEERAQRIYCLIDKGRTMLMPFNELSLLDYAINASLALSNVVLQRRDRAGLLTFSDKLGDVLPADSKPEQLRRILDTLYRQEEREGESNYDLLYYASRRFLGGRSLLLLFTNFESNYALERILPVLRRIARAHRLVVILFENTEIADLVEEPVTDFTVETVYLKSTARRYLQERQLIAARLRQNGIDVVLTRPEQLTGSAISAYLDIKRGGGI